MSEKWKPIDGYEGYQVSNKGRISSTKQTCERILVPDTNSTAGYGRVVLYSNGTRKKILVHRLVAIAYVPNPENKPCVNHKDGNKLNNHFTNLEWCTPKENLDHAFKTGLRVMPKGENHYLSKLSDKTVGSIRHKYATGKYTQKELATMYNCDQSHIHQIVKNKVRAV